MPSSHCPDQNGDPVWGVFHMAEAKSSGEADLFVEVKYPSAGFGTVQLNCWVMKATPLLVAHSEFSQD